MGRQGKNSSYRHKGPYCPRNGFCVFLKGNSPEGILSERNYLRKRVDELEGALEFSTAQIISQRKYISELESDKSQLEAEVVQALRAPFTKYAKV